MHAGSVGVFFVVCLCDQPLVAAFRFRCIVCNKAPYTQTDPLIRAKNPATIGLDLNWVSPNLDELCYGTITTCFRFDLRTGGKCRPIARIWCLIHSFQCKSIHDAVAQSTCWHNHIVYRCPFSPWHWQSRRPRNARVRLYNYDTGCRGLEQANLFAGKALFFQTALSCCETSPASLVDFVLVGQVGVASFGSSSRCPLAIARQVRWLVSRRVRGRDQNEPRRLT